MKISDRFMCPARSRLRCPRQRHWANRRYPRPALDDRGAGTQVLPTVEHHAVARPNPLDCGELTGNREYLNRAQQRLAVVDRVENRSLRALDDRGLRDNGRILDRGDVQSGLDERTRPQLALGIVETRLDLDRARCGIDGVVDEHQPPAR
jgi:hypothetical protein